MSRQCMVTGKITAHGNNVAHCNKKVRREFKASVRWKRLFVPSENRYVRLLISSRGLRTIDKVGIDTVLAELRQRGVVAG